MQACGNILGGCVAPEDVAFQHLGQLVTGHVSKIPAGGRVCVYLVTPSFTFLPHLSSIKTPTKAADKPITRLQTIICHKKTH